MTKANRSVNYVDVVCDIRQIERIVESLQDIIRQWRNFNDFEKLDLWVDLQIDDWSRLIDGCRRKKRTLPSRQGSVTDS